MCLFESLAVSCQTSCMLDPFLEVDVFYPLKRGGADWTWGAAAWGVAAETFVKCDAADLERLHTSGTLSTAAHTVGII